MDMGMHMVVDMEMRHEHGRVSKWYMGCDSRRARHVAVIMCALQNCSIEREDTRYGHCEIVLVSAAFSGGDHLSLTRHASSPQRNPLPAVASMRVR